MYPMCIIEHSVLCTLEIDWTCRSAMQYADFCII